MHGAEVRTRRPPASAPRSRYVFPEHWSFLWGEIALYCFVVLVVTGTYMTFFFDPTTTHVVYHGSYAPLRGQDMHGRTPRPSTCRSTCRAGLLARQTHHWAADVFLAAITIHMTRVFFTGAFRKPREVTFWTGLTLLAAAVLEGYMGYSMVDDLLSGMGLAIGWSVAASIPVVGGPFATLLWDGPFPGGTAFESRLYIAHVLLVPVLIGALIGLHLLLVSLLHHTQFRGPRETGRNVVGLRLWPAYAVRSLALFAAVTGVLVVMGGLVQINPIWLYGPFHTYLSENGAQPDWYIGWLIGALRLVPSWEPTAFGRTLVPNPFWGGVLFPLMVFATLYAWPVVERRLSGDRATHNILERPSDNPWRTAFGAAFATWVAVPFFAGSLDRILLAFGIDYEGQVTTMRCGGRSFPCWSSWRRSGSAVLFVARRRLRRPRLPPIRRRRVRFHAVALLLGSGVRVGRIGISLAVRAGVLLGRAGYPCVRSREAVTASGSSLSGGARASPTAAPGSSSSTRLPPRLAAAPRTARPTNTRPRMTTSGMARSAAPGTTTIETSASRSTTTIRMGVVAIMTRLYPSPGLA